MQIKVFLMQGFILVLVAMVELDEVILWSVFQIKKPLCECKWLVLLSEIIVFFNRQDNSISLVKACWNELFTLGLAQCSQVMNVATILTAFVNHLHGSLQQGKVHTVRIARLGEILNVLNCTEAFYLSFSC